jgi:hypothetical protein
MMAMRSSQPAEKITRQLQEALDRLQLDLIRVELWAAALEGFQRPVPNYEPNDDLLLPRSKPAELAKSKR